MLLYKMRKYRSQNISTASYLHTVNLGSIPGVTSGHRDRSNPWAPLGDPSQINKKIENINLGYIKIRKYIMTF